MSVEFGLTPGPEERLLSRFFTEIAEALDESVPFTRRAALIKKWCIVLDKLSSKARRVSERLGGCGTPRGPREAEEVAEELIRLAVDIIVDSQR